MNTCLTILALLFSLMVFPQRKIHDFSSVDQQVRFIRIVKTDSLAKQLAALGKTDIEKVRAIFRWITEHIDYNMKVFNRNKNAATNGFIFEDPLDSIAPLPSLNERVAEKVLKRKTAFCDGYSRLFKTLCDHAGIRSEIIMGYARNMNSRSGNRFAVNHTWNAVYIDSTWQLLDVTWASGFVSYSNEYTRQYNDFYFLTAPEQFIVDHYPEDLQWTLLSDPPDLREFKQGPFRYSSFVRSGIISYWPVSGVIEAAIGDSIRIELKTKNLTENFFIAESAVPDSSQLFFKPIDILNPEKVSFTHTISNNAKDWLYIFYNDEIVMRYKLNVKKEKVQEPVNRQGF
jgi:transglutaminase/protease-like cytokinesis protein 3